MWLSSGNSWQDAPSVFFCWRKLPSYILFIDFVDSLYVARISEKVDECVLYSPKLVHFLEDPTQVL